MNFVLLTITLIGFCLFSQLLADEVGVIKNLNQINDFLQRLDQNLTKINFDKEVQITISNDIIQLKTESNNLLINTPSGNLLLTKFDSILLKITSTHNSSHHNDSSKHDSCHHNDSSKPDSSHQKETPVDLSKWKDSLLLKGSKQLDSLINSTNRLYENEFCFFNVTNPEQIEQGKKPILNELCGFVFRQKRTSYIDSWKSDEKYIMIRQKKSYHYIGSLDSIKQNITILNVPLMYVYDEMDRFKNKLNLLLRPFIEKLLIRPLKKFPMFITRPIDEFLIHGYKDNLQEFVRDLEKSVGPYVDHGLFKLFRLPYFINVWGNFSLFGFRNNTDDGLLTLNTGKFNLKDVGTISEINRNNISSYFSNPCNVIKGIIDDMIDNPIIFMNETKSIDVYVNQFNRSISFENRLLFNDSYHKRFEMSNKTFNSGFFYAPNKCYNLINDNLTNLFGILRTNPNEPIVYSNPHFMNDNGYFSYQMYGLKPNASLHQSYIDFNRYQNHFIISKLSHQVNYDTKTIAKERNMKRFVFPVYWTSEIIQPL